MKATQHPHRNQPPGLRRTVLRTAAVTLAAAMLPAAMLPSAQAQDLPRPKGPITISIVDVAGDLALTQDAFELYAKQNPNVVSKFTFTKAPAPELPGKLKAQQAAGRSDIDLVLTGTDCSAAGIEQGL